MYRPGEHHGCCESPSRDEVVEAAAGRAPQHTAQAQCSTRWVAWSSAPALSPWAAPSLGPHPALSAVGTRQVLWASLAGVAGKVRGSRMLSQVFPPVSPGSCSSPETTGKDMLRLGVKGWSLFPVFSPPPAPIFQVLQKPPGVPVRGAHVCPQSWTHMHV